MANFERPRMNANSLLASPTGLSPYLRFGCLSCRLFYFKLSDLYRKVGWPAPHTLPGLQRHLQANANPALFPSAMPLCGPR